MKKNEGLYIIAKQVGSAKKLAKLVGIPCSTLSSWMCGWRKLPLEKVQLFVDISNGTVTKNQLRPDAYNDLIF